MRICCISDTHRSEHLVEIPKCDLLLHAGDFDLYDLNDCEILNRYFGIWKEKAKNIVFCAGNHDFYCQKIHPNFIQEVINNAIYLQDSSVTINGLKIYASPWSPIFGNWAFMLPGDELKKKWEQISKDTDILLTHAPPYGILDNVLRANGDLGENVGCPHLRDKVKEIQPKLHVFGHIHGSYGKYTDYKTNYINASLMNEAYELANKPIILEI